MKKIGKIALILIALLCAMFIINKWEEPMYHIDLVDSYGYEFYSILGEFETVEDAIKCIENHISGELEKLTDNFYLDGHDVYNIYRR